MAAVTTDADSDIGSVESGDEEATPTADRRQDARLNEQMRCRDAVCISHVRCDDCDVKSNTSEHQHKFRF